MTTTDDQKPMDTTEADSAAGVSCAAASGSVPTFETVEDMVKWFDGQPAGQYDMLFSSEGAEITTPAPLYETLSSIKDKRCGAVVWDKLARVCANALNEALQRPDEVGSVARSGSPAKRESGPQQSAEAPRSPAKREIAPSVPAAAGGTQ